MSCVLFPAQLTAQAPGGSILGQVRIAPGWDLKSPVMVTLESRGLVTNTVYTDSQGHFGFNGLPGNLYHVVINEKEYQLVREEVPIDPIMSSVRVLTIFLTPREEKKNEKSSAVSGGNAHVTDSAQYASNIPKPALNEFKKGVNSDHSGDVDEAIRHYGKAVGLAPDFYAARNNLGSDLMAKGQLAEAQEQFEAVVKINPADASAYFNLANLFLLARQYDKAMSWAGQGLSKEPDSAFGHFLQGSLYAHDGRAREAEAAFHRSLELDPSLAKAHLALVNLYVQQQRTGDAVAELRTFLKEFPHDPLVPKAKEVLTKLSRER
jgi:tetratricopeptide (TPR) repeat protein